jgi:hypothetical protein
MHAALKEAPRRGDRVGSQGDQTDDADSDQNPGDYVLAVIVDGRVERQRDDRR